MKITRAGRVKPNLRQECCRTERLIVEIHVFASHASEETRGTLCRVTILSDWDVVERV